jgi:hypothetical protein
MQGRYSTRLNYRPTLLCPNYDNLSVLKMRLIEREIFAEFVRTIEIL